MGKFIDMTGWVMSEHGVPESRLTVINKDHTEKVGNRTRVYWNCKCSCGNYICLSSHSISSKGATKSCGCLNIEKIRQQGLKNRKYNKWSEKQSDEYGEYYIGYATNTNEPFYVDAQDFDTVRQYSWRTHCPSKTSPDFKILLAYVLGSGRKTVKMHQLIGCSSWDHIDHNELNNRRYNLRKASQLDNVRNSKRARNNTSGFTGVSWQANVHRWRARIMIDHKEVALGMYDDKEDAIKARLEGEKKYFGEFAPQKHLFKEYGVEED